MCANANNPSHWEVDAGESEGQVILSYTVNFRTARLHETLSQNGFVDDT